MHILPVTSILSDIQCITALILYFYDEVKKAIMKKPCWIFLLIAALGQ
jgi:hypothetical protein